MSNNIKFKIDVTDFVKDLESLGENIIEDIQDKIKDFSKAAYNEALRLAAQRLHTTAIHFQNNLKYEEAGKNVYIIYLAENSPADPFEEGFDKFDMKPGFLNSSKARRTKKGGKYLTIPIQQHPSSQRPGGTRKIVDMRSAVASVLKDKTVDKRIEEYNSQAIGLSRFGRVTKYINIPDPKVAGLVKVQPPGKKGSKYYLFRRVSDKSAKQKWIHPGFAGADIFSSLDKYVKDGIESIIKGTIG